MESISVRQRVRPTRYAFIVRPGDRNSFLTAVSLNSVLWGGMFNPVVPLGPEAEVGAWLGAFDPEHLVNLTGEDLPPHLAAGFKWRIHSSEEIVRDAQDRRRRRFNIGVGMGAVLRFIHDTELRGATGRSRAAIVTNVPEPWQPYAAAVFGTFDHLPGPPVDVASSYKALAMAGDVAFDPDADADYAASIFPIGTTGYGIRRFGGWQSFSSHIVYVGNHQELGDLAEFWNIRASGREVWFVPAANYRNHRTMIERAVKAGQYDINPRVRNRVVLQKAVGVPAEVFNEIRDWIGGLGLTEIMAHVGRPPFRVPGDDDFIGWGISDLEASSGDEQSILSDGRMTPIKLMAPPFLDKEERFAEHEWTIELRISNPYSSEELTCQLPKAPGAEDLVRSLIVGGRLGDVRLGHNGIVVGTESHRDTVYPNPVKTSDVFRMLLEKATGLKVVPSQAGRYAEQIIKKMGSLQFNCRVFNFRGVREVIAKLSNGSTLTKGNMYAIVSSTTPDAFGQNWREDLHDEMSGGPGKLDFSAIFDELLAKRIIRPGMSFTCGNCSASDWYHVSEFAEDYTCRYCFERQRIHFGSAKEWQYKSDGLFRIPDSAQGSLTTILALWRLIEVRSGFGGRYCTGVNLLGPDGNVVCEPDYCFLRVDDFTTKYDLVLGEAKAFMDYEADKIGRLTEIADKLDKKPYLAFATLKDQFNDQEKDLLRGLIGNGYRVIPLTRLELDPYYLWKRFENAPQKHVVSFDDLSASSIYMNLR
jgi:hypothetical protein